MRAKLDSRDWLKLARVSLLAWLLFPFPVWVIGSGFAGKFELPDFGVFSGYGVELWVIIFDLIFYLPLVAAVLLIANAVSARKRKAKSPDAAD